MNHPGILTPSSQSIWIKYLFIYEFRFIVELYRRLFAVQLTHKHIPLEYFAGTPITIWTYYPYTFSVRHSHTCGFWKALVHMNRFNPNVCEYVYYASVVLWTPYFSINANGLARNGIPMDGWQAGWLADWIVIWIVARKCKRVGVNVFVCVCVGGLLYRPRFRTFWRIQTRHEGSNRSNQTNERTVRCCAINRNLFESFIM